MHTFGESRDFAGRKARSCFCGATRLPGLSAAPAPDSAEPTGRSGGGDPIRAGRPGWSSSGFAQMRAPPTLRSAQAGQPTIRDSVTTCYDIPRCVALTHPCSSWRVSPEGAKHGYAITRDVHEIAGITLGPGTLYGAIARLEGRGLIEPLEADDRRRPYRLTESGAAVLREQLIAQERVASVGLRRLSAAEVRA